MKTALKSKPTKTEQKILVPIAISVTSIDETARTVEFVASDETVDRYGEVIVQDGWDLNNMMKNPQLLFGHDYSALPVGRVVEIGIEDAKLVALVEIGTEEDNPLCPYIWSCIKKGYLRAVSVGLIPKEWDGEYITRAELLEISIVTVPANPNALVRAYKEGVIDKKGAQMFIEAQEKSIAALTKAVSNKDNDDMSSEVLEAVKANTAAVTALVDAIKAKDAGEQDPPEVPTPTNPPADPVPTDPPTPNADDPKDPANPAAAGGAADPQDPPAPKPGDDEPDDFAEQELNPDDEIDEETGKKLQLSIKDALAKSRGAVD